MTTTKGRVISLARAASAAALYDRLRRENAAVDRHAMLEQLASRGALNCHVDARGEYTEGWPCVRGWYENESEADAIGVDLARDGYRVVVARDDNAGREWFWVCVWGRVEQ